MPPSSNADIMHFQLMCVARTHQPVNRPAPYCLSSLTDVRYPSRHGALPTSINERGCQRRSGILRDWFNPLGMVQPTPASRTLARYGKACMHAEDSSARITRVQEPVLCTRISTEWFSSSKANKHQQTKKRVSLYRRGDKQAALYGH